MLISILLIASAHAGDPAIGAHLYEVASTLRAQTPATLSPDQRASRLDLLDVLESYAAAGEYPVHDRAFPAHARTVIPPRHFDGPGHRAPVFVDGNGTHCAVGYLMAATGSPLVEGIVATENDAYVLEMRTAGVADWADDHGFTVNELAWIQPSYAHEPVRNCDTFELPPLRAADDPSMDEPYLNFVGMACHTCGGPLSVFVRAQNYGKTPTKAFDINIQLGAANNYSTPPDGEVVSTTTLAPIPPGHHADVGVFQVSGSLNRLYNDDLDVYLVATQGTIPGHDKAWDSVWIPARGWFENLYPYECDEVRDPEPPPPLDTGEDDWHDQDPIDDGREEVKEDKDVEPATSCSSVATPAGGLVLLLGIGLAVRRRRG